MDHSDPGDSLILMMMMEDAALLSCGDGVSFLRPTYLLSSKADGGFNRNSESGMFNECSSGKAGAKARLRD